MLNSLPLWLHESIIYGTAAFVFCSFIAPLSYWVGVRDGRRGSRATWIAIGYTKACYLMGVERHRETFFFPHISAEEMAELYPKEKRCPSLILKHGPTE